MKQTGICSNPQIQPHYHPIYKDFAILCLLKFENCLGKRTHLRRHETTKIHLCSKYRILGCHNTVQFLYSETDGRRKMDDATHLNPMSAW